MRCPRCTNGTLIKDPYGDAPQCLSCGYYHVISVGIDQRARREVVMMGSTAKAPTNPEDYEL